MFSIRRVLRQWGSLVVILRISTISWIQRIPRISAASGFSMHPEKSCASWRRVCGREISSSSIPRSWENEEKRERESNGQSGGYGYMACHERAAAKGLRFAAARLTQTHSPRMIVNGRSAEGATTVSEAQSAESNGGALSKKSEPISARIGAAAEKPSGWGQPPRLPDEANAKAGHRKPCRTSQQNRKRAR